MRRQKFGAIAASLLVNGVLAMECIFIIDAVAVSVIKKMNPVVYVAIFGVLFLGFGFLRNWSIKQKWRAVGWIAGVCAVLCLLCLGAVRLFQRTKPYEAVDAHKGELYQNRSVMVIIPHQDDEVNIMAGVIEEYLKYGSTLRLVYTTNGDRYEDPEIRMREALVYAQHIGIPEENVIFLGYGDGYSTDSPYHLYNAPSGVVVTSVCGNTETTGLDTHPAYTEGRAYTMDNYLSDMESVILEFRPDVIFCTDYDKHIEHMSTTLLFEKAMGRILRQNPDYQPRVFKGYAYNAAWFAESDYHKLNIRSTQNIFAEPYWQKPAVYRWEDRVRFPVAAQSLSRSMLSAAAYQSLLCFESQAAWEKASGVINGDKVFWQRRTDSLCANGEISVSSGDGSLLNDFMLIENHDLMVQENPFDSVWIPEESDSEKRVSVVLPEKVELYSIVLYDHPSETENVLNAVIRFDDGTELETGPLDIGGAATEIPVHRSVNAFEVFLTQTEGAQAGLTEVEALPQAVQGEENFLKLTDTDGNFVYDYWLPLGREATFPLYAYPAGSVAADGYSVSCDNGRIAVTCEQDGIKVDCPTGEQGIVTVKRESDGLSDSVMVRNPGLLQTMLIKAGQEIEAFFAVEYRQMIVYKAGKLIAERIGIL